MCDSSEWHEEEEGKRWLMIRSGEQLELLASCDHQATIEPLFSCLYTSRRSREFVSRPKQTREQLSPLADHGHNQLVSFAGHGVASSSLCV